MQAWNPEAACNILYVQFGKLDSMHVNMKEIKGEQQKPIIDALSINKKKSELTCTTS